MKVLHFSDLHVWRCEYDWSDPWYPKRWLGFLNLAFHRRKKFPPGLAINVARHIASQEADLVIFTGDYTTMSLESEYAEASELTRPIREKWKERFIEIPGNHDRYTPGSSMRYEKWFPDGRIDGVRTWEIDDVSVVVGYDASRPFALRSNGLLTDELEQKLDSELARQAGKSVVLIGHYPFANPPEHPEASHHQLLGEERLAALVAKHGPVAYLHGHKHVRWQLRSDLAPATLCLNAGSAGMRSASSNKQAGYLTFEWEENEVRNVEFIVPGQKEAGELGE
ncbi:MAG: metallophosphoesterase [Verrucomicrobiota bacterium]